MLPFIILIGLSTLVPIKHARTFQVKNFSPYMNIGPIYRNIDFELSLIYLAFNILFYIKMKDLAIAQKPSLLETKCTHPSSFQPNGPLESL